ncbi:hypothetical protein HDU67_000962 [Dinochytrium kinnereticum]|nr:hypothetical protein HDU67_000962 [Dinochytrium kinnereticum]
MNLRDPILFSYSICFTIINLILLSTWYAIDPLLATKITNEDSGTYHYECRSKSSSIQESFTITLLIYNGLLLSIAIFLAYASKKVLSSYRETAYILYGAQNIFICCIVVLGLVYGVSRGAYLSVLYLRLVLTWISTTFVFGVTMARIASATLVSKESVIKLFSTRDNSSNKRDSETGSELQQKSADLPELAGDAVKQVELTLPVKDGSRALSTWKKKLVIYNTVSRNFEILDPKTLVGEAAVFNSTVSISKSVVYTDCLDVRYGTRYRILQFQNSVMAERFLALTMPGLKVGLRVSGLGDDPTRLKRVAMV